jgi:hypothetical protein
MFSINIIIMPASIKVDSKIIKSLEKLQNKEVLTDKELVEKIGI